MCSPAQQHPESINPAVFHPTHSRQTHLRPLLFELPSEKCAVIRHAVRRRVLPSKQGDPFHRVDSAGVVFECSIRHCLLFYLACLIPTSGATATMLEARVENFDSPE